MISDLIYDLGMCWGEDTSYYLKRGYRVVGIEADPRLAAHCRRRFAEEIACRRLTLLEGAVSDCGGTETIFYRNLDNEHWGTLCPAWVARNQGRGTRHQACVVPRVDLRECFLRHGVPHFLKIDLEGVDRACLRALNGLHEVPLYLSLESEAKSFHNLLDELSLLESLGYKGFRAVQQSNQADLANRLKLPVAHHFEYGCSGPLPEEWPARWLGGKAIRLKYALVFLLYQLLGTDSWLWHRPWGKRAIRRLGTTLGREVPGWYDTHAARVPS